MASQSGQRIRLVKCPKCLKILQEDEHVPVYRCGGCSAILQAKRRSIAPNTTIPSAGETEGGGQASKPETNNVSSSSGHDTVLPSSPGRSSGGQEDEKARDRFIESTEKQLGRLELSNEEERNDEIQLDKNEGEDESSRLKLSDTKEATEPGTSSRSLSVEHVVDDARVSLSVEHVVDDVRVSLSVEHVVDDARVSNSSSEAYRKLEAEISPDASTPHARPSNSSSDAYRKLETEISPDASPVDEEQNEDGHRFHNQRESPDDDPEALNKTSSAYDGSGSSSDGREDQLLDETEQWNALQKIRSGKFEMPRYPGNSREQGESSSPAFSENRRNGTTTYRSMQLEGPGGRLGRPGRRYVTEQLRPDMPLYPREPFTRGSPSYASHNEFDRYSRAQSLQMYGGINHESVDYMYHNNNNNRAGGRGQGSRFSRIPFSAEMVNDRRHHPGWYSGQIHSSTSYTASPQRPMEQPEYYPAWGREIVSDVEDHHQRNRQTGHHQRELQRQRVAKRHVRPTAGGAPFVSCYRCSENLQLPVDFLIFKKKHHLLRCGTCTTVLRFSLRDRIHLVPALTHEISGHRSSNSTSESPRDKALRSSVQEDEESSPVARGSPLHRLMGYSTVSQVFKASQRPPSL